MVTEVAGDLVDRHGAEALTLALVAKEVGVATPSLYKHVGGLDDLRSRVSAAATIQLSKALAEATVGLAGRDALGRPRLDLPELRRRTSRPLPAHPGDPDVRRSPPGGE